MKNLFAAAKYPFQNWMDHHMKLLYFNHTSFPSNFLDS